MDGHVRRIQEEAAAGHRVRVGVSVVVRPREDNGYLRERDSHEQGNEDTAEDVTFVRGRRRGWQSRRSVPFPPDVLRSPRPS